MMANVTVDVYNIQLIVTNGSLDINYGCNVPSLNPNVCVPIYSPVKRWEIHNHKPHIVGRSQAIQLKCMCHIENDLGQPHYETSLTIVHHVLYNCA